MMPSFKEFQLAWFILVPIVIAYILLSIFFFFSVGSAPLSPMSYGIATGVLGGATLAFYGMKTVVTDKSILISYGIGIIKKVISTDKVIAAEIVKNKWYFGLGIRSIPNGMLFNIHGLTAVELKFSDSKKIIRIGTQKALQLEKSLNSQLLH